MKTNTIGKIALLLMFCSYIITLGILSRIIDKKRSKKEMVYYLSKIATIKNIVKMNH